MIRARSSPVPLPLSRATARRFLLKAFALEQPQSLSSVAEALTALEFLQMDSINVCGRIHDLILASRVMDYRPHHLDGVLYGSPRGAFEQYFPNLSALPLREFPYFVREMRARRTSTEGRRALSAEEIPVAEALLARIAADGPLRARDAGAESGRTRSAWGSTRTLAGHVLETLWRQGRLVVHRRENFERYFDLPSRTLPPELLTLLEGDGDLPDEVDERTFRARKFLRARRLFRPGRQHLQTLTDEIRPVLLEGAERPWAVLAEDLSLLEALRESEPPEATEVNLLAPLDPLIYDRERTRMLFGFDYMWEVYTPKAKRRWGYYVLPILWGDRLAGRVDPKFDRTTGVLHLQSLQLEPGVEVDSLAEPLARALKRYMAFLGAGDVRLEQADSERVRRRIQTAMEQVF